ncbi:MULTISPECIES: ATP-dependent RNA helicase HrpA [Idiomarina]|uniref:ATP-dependent RNA helicase HrpA n=1 Tax=Idiomarina TaxID=135575 RepID=UPI000C3ABB50|nr:MULTISPECIES: ATP-dependent RNA helicase HrpA [Idiomarina]MBP58038.1 ATP-dependent RNA helicase HrpA [Idiomarina sp.]|tara:strand:+ start:9248 stop:13165 length:3918 start_codon:yes stop_codon:yes gene_type:complete
MSRQKSHSNPFVEKFQTQLEQCTTRQAALLRGRLRGLSKIKNEQRQQQVLERIAADIETAELEYLERQQQKFHISYPDELPVAQQRNDIKSAIEQNQVVVIAGETGSGKTTQLPKMLLELGYGRKGTIGHTQPRRLAARSVAARIGEELQDHNKTQVGYKIRFQDETAPTTAIKLMTDGMLLSELQQDPLLLQYDAIIIDEAHERSLNIDFLLGVLHTLLPKRRDLKLVITSATIETERFSKHFHDAPVLTVTGRTYPVEVRYRPPREDGKAADADVLQGVCDAVEELQRESEGDILIFASGEREIRDYAEAIGDLKLRSTEVLPLYARLSSHEQNRVFQAHSQRRVVIATNVAETSLTVPGIRFVIDPGTVRMSRYSYRTKVQRLPIEPISQASANQRKGRCGRIGPGICIRLYSEDDFLQRPEYTDPEILRTNLAAVILQMSALRLGDIRQFPFVQKPDERFVKDGLNLLEELHAIEPGRKAERPQLTDTGRQLSRLPLDPRLARMVLAGQQYGCVREMLVITAALSIQDPRERPHDAQQKADEWHQRFRDKSSDFMAFLNLWNYIKEQQKALSGNQFRKQMGREFIHFMRLREWQDIYTQSRQTVREMGLSINDEAATYEQVHRALIAGLLSQVGFKEDRHEYQGTRQSRFHIFPGSGLFGKPPKWVVTAELAETSKLYARINADIEPLWVEEAASHLVKKQYLEPHFEKKKGSVIADEQVTLLGLILVPRRRVQYGPVEPVKAREIFIREALVNSQLTRKLPFIQHNLKLISDIQALEAKSRRRDILVDEEVLFEAYDRAIPEGIYNEKLLAGWWHKAAKKEPKLLFFERNDLIAGETEHITENEYPEFWRQGNLRLPLSYHFEPNAEDDGVSVNIQLGILNQVKLEGFDWHIPALREERIAHLIKSLPKALRRNFVPAPNFAGAIMADVEPMHGRLTDAMATKLRRMTGVTVPEENWDESSLPAHLRMNFKIFDGKKLVSQGRDLQSLQQQLSGKVQQRLEKTAGDDISREQVDSWDFDDLPEVITERQQGFELKAYPGLINKGKGQVALQLFDNPEQAKQHHKTGVRELLLQQIPSPVKHLQKSLSNKAKLAMYFNPWGKVDALIADCIAAAVDGLIQEQIEQGNKLRDKQSFGQLKDVVRTNLNERVEKIALEVEQCLLLSQQVRKALKGKIPLDQIQSRGDIQDQLDNLVFAGFVSAYGSQRLSDIVRYLKAIQRRLEKLPVDPNKDRLMTLTLANLEEQYKAVVKAYENKSSVVPDDVAEIRWMIEELRVSFFAQTLGTKYPVSEKRVKQAIEAAK